MDSSGGTREVWLLVKALLIGNADVSMGSCWSCDRPNIAAVGTGISLGCFHLASRTENAHMKSTVSGLKDALHISLMRPDAYFLCTQKMVFYFILCYSNYSNNN